MATNPLVPGFGAFAREAPPPADLRVPACAHTTPVRAPHLSACSVTERRLNYGSPHPVHTVPPAPERMGPSLKDALTRLITTSTFPRFHFPPDKTQRGPPAHAQIATAVGTKTACGRVASRAELAAPATGRGGNRKSRAAEEHRPTCQGRGAACGGAQGGVEDHACPVPSPVLCTRPSPRLHAALRPQP